MKITVITLFPKMIKPFFKESIIKRAQDKNLVEINVLNLRDFAKDSHGTVDDRPYGGGAGMVLMAQPLVEAINSLKSKTECRPLQSESQHRFLTVLTSPRGKVYNQKTARAYAKLDHLVIIAGHYEGVDERVLDYVDEEVSIGDYILTGGEIAAAVIVDSVVRLIPRVLKKEEAVNEESFFSVSIDRLIDIVGNHKVLKRLKDKGRKRVVLLEYPHYTRPVDFRGRKVPPILLSGNHLEIKRWRIKKAFELTLKKRKDLLV